MSNVEEYLLENMDSLIMEPMAKFYRAHELKKFKLLDYIAHAKVRMAGHPAPDLIEKLISKIETEPEIELLHGQLHFDLHAGNILKDGNKIVIIDWEVTHPGLVLVDYFDFYRRYLNKTKSVDTEKLKVFHAKYQNWLRQFGVEATNPELTMRLYALERTLMYWDKWKENRLKDQRGMEFKIASRLKN
jgi:thiamine kinase-like enzyme